MCCVAFSNFMPVPGKCGGNIPLRGSNHRSQPSATVAAHEPLLIRAARRQSVPRPPVWLMRQAGRYMAAFREYSDQYPFRHRSESPEIAIELSLQPYRAFGTDAVIMFSDILTPLPALGVQFDVISGSGPVISDPIRTSEQISSIVNSSFEPHITLPFISEILTSLRSHLSTDPEVTLMGFVGAPFTLAAYMIEGRAVKNVTNIKRFIYSQQDGADSFALHALLDKLSDSIAKYAIYQIDNGAQAVQLFDSWAHHLSPQQYAEFALPYARKVARIIKEARPRAVVFFFANGSAGKMTDISEQMSEHADVIGLDWSVRMSDARRVFGNDVVLQGNVDPSILMCGSEQSIRQAVRDTVDQAGSNIILNLGHGVIKETPESSVNVFVNEAKSLAFSPIS